MPSGLRDDRKTCCASRYRVIAVNMMTVMLRDLAHNTKNRVFRLRFLP